MIEHYLEKKARLYSRFSRFVCDDACPRYGCESDLTVSVSLIEVFALARFLDRTAAGLFDLAFMLAPYPDEGLSRVRVRIVLKKPCVFLDSGKLCSVHAARPAACALFPEFLGLLHEKERREYITDNDIAAYPCIGSEPLSLSPERAETIHELQQLREREMYATDLSLFGLAGFSVDLREDVLALCPAAAGGTAHARVVRLARIEEALDHHLKRTGLYRETMSKIAGLEENSVGTFLSFLDVADTIMALHS